MCDVLCTTFAGALVRIEDGQGKRQTVMLLDPDLKRWPARLRDRLPSHPRLCALQQGEPQRVQCADRTFYYVGTEPLSGWTVLDEIVREGAIRPLARAVRFCAEAAEALAHAHAAGAAHGHLEPGCLFIQSYAEEDEGHIKLLGAGLAITAPPASRAARYRAPQAGTPRSQKARQAADLLALGGVLYHMLTGQAPAFPCSARALAGLPQALQAIAMRALETDPARRLPSARSLREELLQLQLTPQTAPSSAARWPRWPRCAAATA